MNAFHDCSTGKGTAAQQAAFFLHPEPRIFILHGEDVFMQGNYEIHQKLTDEKHATVGSWDITPLCNAPERARGRQGLLGGAPKGALVKCHVGEDWIVQRVPSGELKIALFVNTFHMFLPDSAPISFT